MTSKDSLQNNYSTPPSVTLCDNQNGIFSLQIEAVESNNVLSKDLIKQLINAIDTVKKADSVKVLIFNGTKNSFLCGGRKHYNEAVEQGLYETIVAFPYPVIASMQGDSTGAGFLVGALCDFMICSQSGNYCYTKPAEGLFPSAEEEFLFNERFGQVLAKDFLYHSTKSTGKQLQKKGWNCPILSHEKVDDYTQKLAINLAKKSHDSLRLLKQHLTRHIYDLTKTLYKVNYFKLKQQGDTEKPEFKITILRKHIKLETYADKVLVIKICNTGRKYQPKTLVSDLSSIFTEVNKHLGDDNFQYRSIVITSEHPEFIPGLESKNYDDIVLDFKNLLLQSPLTVIAVLDSDISSKVWLISQFFDAAIYKSNGVYCAASILENQELAKLAVMIFTYRFGNSFGREILLTGDKYSGIGLLRGMATLPVAAEGQVLTTALKLAETWAELPLDKIVSWKKWMAFRIQEKINQLPPWLESGTPRIRTLPDSPKLTELNSKVINTVVHSEGIIVIKMEDRNEKNMFSDAVIEGMTEVFEHIEKTPIYKVVVLTGYDKYFASGGTKEALLAIQEGKTKFTDSKIYQLALACKVPVVAAMQGHGVGAGLSLGLFADFTVFSQESKYVSPYMSYGFTPGAGATLIVTDKFGYDLARETLLTAQEYSGSELKDRGMLSAVYPGKQVLQTAIELAKKIAQNSRSCLISIKDQLNYHLHEQLAETENREIAMHELTFVGQVDTLKQIQNTFNKEEEGIKPDDTKNTCPVPVVENNNNVSDGEKTNPTNIQYDTDIFQGIIENLRKLLAQELHLEEYEIDENAQFVDLGLDSITGVTWIRKINEKYLTSLEATVVYSYPTLTKLGCYVKEEIQSLNILANKPFNIDFDDTQQNNIPTLLPSSDEDILLEVTASLRKLLAQELHLDEQEIDEDKQFVDLGLDSITSVTWVRKINEKYLTQLEATVVYSYPTLGKLSRHIKENAKILNALTDKSVSADCSDSQKNSSAVSLSPPDTDILLEITAGLKELLAQELHLDEQEIDENKQFIDIGLDSITSVTLIRKVNDKYLTSLEATVVYSHPTLSKLSTHIKQEVENLDTLFSTSKIVEAEPSPIEKDSHPYIRELVSWRNRDLTSIETNTLSTSQSQSEIGISFTSQLQPIAVIGMAGQFPMAKNVDEYWKNIAQGKNCISEVPKIRWNMNSFFQNGEPVEGKTNCKWAGMLEQYDMFDPLFFNISPIEARGMDPEQRLFLQACWQSIEDAGYNTKSLSGSQCGVFVGCATGEYNRLSQKLQLSAYGFTGGDSAILAARISYFLNLQGPCLSIHTACSSSLVAIANASDSLNSGGCDLALAGGVSVLCSPMTHIMTSQSGMLSTDGRCYTFDQRANGFVPGEGVGVVLLKRLSDAQRDNDIIETVIQGWGINQDGKTNGITAPNPESQSQLQQSIYNKFKIDPSNIQLIEAHGTGTALGDPIEIEGLKKSFKKYTKKKQFCAVGSVKPNIGHCLMAAGISGFIKTLLALKHKKLPPSINFKQLNKHINLTNSPFYVNTHLQDWELKGAARRQAAVSSFGYSGTNVHLVIAEHVPSSAAKSDVSVIAQNSKIIVPISAKTKQQLQQKCHDLLKFTRKEEQTIDLIALAYTLQVGRDAMEERIGFLANSVNDLAEKLGAYVAGEGEIKDSYYGQTQLNKEGLSIISQDDEIKETIVNNLIDKKNLSKLLKLWAKGLELDWNKLYGQVKPLRITLPTYPFAKERYWIDNLDTKFLGGQPSNSATATILHPLLHSNTSNLSQQSYSSIFAGDEFFLRGHQLQTGTCKGQRVLPEITYLEMARAATERASPTTQKSGILELQNIVWGQSFVTADNNQITIALYTSGADNSSLQQIDFEIYSQNKVPKESNQETVHCQGEARFTSKPAPANINLLQLKGQMNKDSLEADSVYEALAEMGLHYDPPYRGIMTVFQGEQQVLAKLCLPLMEENAHNAFLLHPSLMDGVLHTSVRLIANTAQYTGQPLFPSSLNLLNIISACTKEMFVWIRHSASGVLEREIVKLDVDLCDENGNICMQMRGLSLQQISEQKLSDTKNVITGTVQKQTRESELQKVETSQQLFFQEYWQEQPLTKTAEFKTDHNQTIIFTDTEFQDAIKNSDKPKQFRKSIFVHQAKNYRQISTRKYHCRFDNLDDIRKIIDHVSKVTNKPISIIYTWAKNRKEIGIHNLINLFKAIKVSTNPVASVILVGRYDPSNLDTCWDYSWVSFERSLKLLLPSVDIALLYTHSSLLTPQQLVDISQHGGVLWYKYNQRFKLSFKSQKLNNKTPEPLVKYKGTYLITGGCGALGLKFAHYLAETYQVKLLLLGRRSLSSSIQKQLDKLKQSGAEEVHYHSVDITDKEALNTWAEKLTCKLSGIFHAAGIESFQAFDKKTKMEINQVLNPKTIATILFDKVLHNTSICHPLDFVCYFSSSSGLLGDFGSCDYAIANRFQMAYGHYRQQNKQLKGKTLVINWPLWQKEENQEGGMGQADPRQAAFYLKSSGQDALEKNVGLQIWQDILQADQVQTLVMVGKPSRIKQFLYRTYHVEKPLQIPTILQVSPSHFGKGWKLQYQDLSLKECVILEFKQLISTRLQIEISRLNITTNLADYGFDSISLATFAKQLTAYFFIEVTPALFFNYATIQQLANYFVDEHQQHLQEFYSSQETHNVDQVKDENQKIEAADLTKIKPLSRRRFINNTSFATSRWTHGASNKREPIAIIGMSGRFPQADNVNQLWNLLETGKSGITEVPSSRWNWREYFNTPGDTSNKISTNKGGFIDGIDEFDPLFFEISPLEAEEMDPAERLLLMEAYRAIEDASLSPASLRGSNVGVFVGMEESQYSMITAQQGVTTAGNAMISSRLSYFLDLHGPTISINTACSSGLVALHQAAMSLRQGECESALVAGVALNLSPLAWIKMSEVSMISEDGHCFSFSNKANGIGIGEAVVVLMLKPLSSAVAGDDPIYGTIKASGINFDGKTNGVTAPSGKMQEKLIDTIYTDNDISVSDISHIVAHGTGTKLGDPVEINALNDAFRKLYKQQRIDTEQKSQCAITSCKTNLGHTLAASGLVSLVGLLKGIEYHKIPASLHCEEENDYINWKDSPFFINKHTQDWKGEGDKPLMGGVSAFGRSGTNIHVVIEEYRPPIAVEQPLVSISNNTRVIIPLSAKSAEQLKQKARDLLDLMFDPENTRLPEGKLELSEKSYKTVDLTAMAYTLQVGREPMEERLGFVVSSVEQLTEKLNSYIYGERYIEDFFQGTVNQKDEGMNILSQDEDMKDTIEKWIACNKLSKLANLWVKGLDLDWAKLYIDGKPKRINLPTYPFAKDRYWIDSVDLHQYSDKKLTPDTSLEIADNFASIEEIINKIDGGEIETNQAVKLLKTVV